MSKMIKVTRFKRALYLNADNIDMVWSDREGCTQITNGEDTWEVEETVEEVLVLIQRPEVSWLKARVRRLEQAIQGAVDISDCWRIVEEVFPEHEGEAQAVDSMYHQFKELLEDTGR